MNDEFRIHLRGMPQPDMPEGEWIRTIAKPTREELLLSYAQKPVRGFMQVDAHGLCEDGVVIHTHFLYELLKEDWHRLDVVDGKGHGGRPKLRRKEA
jgi:hypothetical protein